MLHTRTDMQRSCETIHLCASFSCTSKCSFCGFVFLICSLNKFSEPILHVNVPVRTGQNSHQCASVLGAVPGLILLFSNVTALKVKYWKFALFWTITYLSFTGLHIWPLFLLIFHQLLMKHSLRVGLVETA